MGGPEQVRAQRHGAGLVGFLEQPRGGQSAVSPQSLVVLLAEASQALESADYESDSCALLPGVRNLLLVQTVRLEGPGDRLHSRPRPLAS